MISKLKYEYLLVLIAIFFSLIVVYTMQINHQTYIFGDTNSYVLAAKELFLQSKLNDHRPLVITLISGLPLLFDLDENSLFTWSFILNYFCWLSTIVLLFKIGIKYIDRKKSFVFSLFYVFCIGNFFIVFHLLSETVFTFLLVLVVHFLLLFNQKKDVFFLTSSISVLILMTMIKPLSMGLVFILLFIYFKDLKLVFTSKYSISILMCLVVLGIQLIGMKKQYGDYTISYIDGLTYYNYLGTKADCLKKNIEFKQGKNERVLKLKDKSMMEIKLIAKKDFKHQLKNNKTNLLKAFFLNIFNNSSKGSASIHACINVKGTAYFDCFSYIFKAISKIQNIFLTIFGLIVALYFIIIRTNKVSKLMATVIVYFILVSAISSDQGDRFHIVFYPIIIILIITSCFKKAPVKIYKVS